MLPTPYVMTDRVRVFYATCDGELRGRIMFADFAPKPPFRLLGASAAPVLDLGAAGAFDMDGVNPSQVIKTAVGLALLYIGWRRGPAEAPYTLFAGLAFSMDDGLTFTRQGRSFLPPRKGERLFRTAPFIDVEEQGYRLLYIGGDAFEPDEGGRRLPRYNLLEMRSESLWDWTGPSRVLMHPNVAAGEIGFGRPVVVRRAGCARLMISVRTREGYQLVETDAALELGKRPPMTPIKLDPLERWEQQMTCFGSICHAEGYELLFYNGNGFGRTGMGLAWRPEL